MNKGESAIQRSIRLNMENSIYGVTGSYPNKIIKDIDKCSIQPDVINQQSTDIDIE